MLESTVGPVPSRDAPGVVVWEADGPADGRRGYGWAVRARLIEAGLSTVTVPVTERRPTAEELAAPVHVLSGGTTPVNARVPWLDAVRESLAPVLDRALAGRASLTGICFGAQLIATQLAGRDAVGLARYGIEAGLTTVRDPERTESHVVSTFHFHGIDPAALRRAGARITLTNDHTPVQAFEAGLGVRGVQFHPELAPASLTAVLHHHGPVLERHRSSTAAAVASVEAGRDRWTTQLFDRFVADPARRMLEDGPVGLELLAS